ncbi:MAG: MerR family transcriptional regulator, partial [Ruthenibacterium sp.]
EWWIADTHTFDILSRGENGKTHRIYINAYLDARSGIFTGWYVTENPSSDASLYALRRGITACGIPNNIYVDNGREYLT